MPPELWSQQTRAYVTKKADQLPMAADSGSITISAAQNACGAAVKGKFEITLPAGTQVSGTFDTTYYGTLDF